jgi:type VI secretion system protein ImpM
VLPFLKPIDEPLNYAIVGKLPNRPDFVRINATHPVVSEFDELIQNAMTQLPDDPENDLRYQSTVTDFYYTSRDQSCVLMGALMGSRDQSGRRFPLFAGVVLSSDQIAAEAALTPIAYEIYFDELRRQIANAIDNAVEAVSCQAYLHTQSGADSGGVVDFALARDIVERFSSHQTVSRLSEVLALDKPCAALDQALLNIACYGDFLRRFENPATVQEVVLPLPVGHGEGALVAAEWLSLLMAAWAKPRWNGSFFVRRDAETAWLAASYGQIPERFLPWIVGGPLNDSVRLNLATEEDAWRAHHYYAETAYALGRLLTDPSASLLSLREALIDIGRKLAQDPR